MAQGTTNEFVFDAPWAAADGMRVLSAPKLGDYRVDSIGIELGRFRAFASALDLVRSQRARRGLRVINYNELTDDRGDGLTADEREQIEDALS